MKLNIEAILTATYIADCMKTQELQQALHKMKTYRGSKNISSEAGQRTDIKYHKT